MEVWTSGMIDTGFWITLVVLAGLLVGMLQERVGPEIVMLMALLILVLTGVLESKEALAGFSDASVVTIAALFVVGAGMRATGAMELVSRWLLGKPKRDTPMARLLAPVAGLSGFMNNTPLVAFLLPVFVDVAKRLRMSPSRLLIPLSYAAVLGGTCTRIGTSTNLTIDGLMQTNGIAGIGMFELAWVGVPVTILGLIYLTTIGQRLLPNREELLEHVEANPREYTVEMRMGSDCPLANQTVRDSGLRDLPGLYLYRIERGGELISPVAPTEFLRANDLLFFSGIVSTVVDLQKIRGLAPVEHRDPLQHAADAGSLDSFEGLPTVGLSKRRSDRQLCEVVIGVSSPLVGHTVKDVDFRARYNASIIAVHRSGQKIEQKIGQIELETGDTLLVDADPDFPRRWRNSPDFVLVSGIEDSAPIAHEHTWIALAIFGATLAGITALPSYTAVVAMLGGAAMVIAGCLTGAEIYRSIELSVLILVGSALGVSKALDSSGAAEWLASGLLKVVDGSDTTLMLAAVVVLTGVMTELLSNNAAAALMATFCIALAEKVQVDPRPLIIAVAVTASYGFATPIGYQTNLMVMNAGNYRVRDYLRVGLPLDVVCWAATILIVPWVWKF